MTEYKVQLSTGKEILIEDARELGDLAATLCQSGFIKVRRINTGGFTPASDTLITLLERAVLSIEQS